MRLLLIAAVALVALGVVGTQVVRVRRACTTVLSAHVGRTSARTTTCEWRIDHP
ncbi:MAG: hypothetical protein WBB74_05965 [Gaiellaceae bacterium]